MLSFITTLFALFLVVSVQGLQINFNSYSEINRYEEMASAMMVKDTAQGHYESIIDDILSQHNEGLLTEMSIVIKDTQQMYEVMRPQAEVLYGLEHASELQDVCVAQMPGMIANQIHELSNEIYTSVDSTVTQFWKTTDQAYRQFLLDAINNGLDEQEVMDELTDALEILNMDITDRITQTVDQFQMLLKLKQALVTCQSVFSADNNQELKEATDNETPLSEKIWHAVLVSFSLSNPKMEVNLEQSGFMGKYIRELKSDIQSEMYSRVYELARSIYEDLAFSSA
ncbi:unnamed protein product [Mucor hiemalis]